MLAEQCKHAAKTDDSFKSCKGMSFRTGRRLANIRSCFTQQQAIFSRIGTVRDTVLTQAQTASSKDNVVQCRLQPFPDNAKLVGLGMRSSSIAARFIEKDLISAEKVWHLDLESRRGDLPLLHQKLLLASDKEYRWVQGSDLSNLLEDGLNLKMGTDAAQQAFSLALVLVTAGNLPGGPESVLCVVDALRAAGHFTAVAVTQPFEFEGKRRVEMAASLGKSLQQAADLVCFVQQNKLMEVTTNAEGSPMTVADATCIADNAQESFVNLAISSLTAEQMMTSQRSDTHLDGLQSWCNISNDPHLLIRDALREAEHCALGQGTAGHSAAVRHPVSSTLMSQLAMHAAAAAADSPFLYPLVDKAETAICTLLLPRKLLEGGSNKELSHAAAGSACQAAGQAIFRSTSCTRVFVTCEIFDEVSDVEASLLLTFNDNETEYCPKQHRHPIGRQSSSSAYSKDPIPPSQHQALGHSEGRAQALSAMAGGSKISNAKGGNTGPYRQRDMDRQAAERNSTASGPASVDPSDDLEDSLSNRLADSLIAQSLDLPPKAAKWRQAQRAKEIKPRMMVQPPEAGWQAQKETDQSLSRTMKTILAGETRKLDVRERMFAIIERDRDDNP